jgi:hypothetical protein
MDRLDELIEQGKKFTFENNRQSLGGYQYGKASDELLGWAASVEDFIRTTYGEENAAFKLYQSFERKKLTGHYQQDFESQLTILHGSLKACKNIPIKKLIQKEDDHQIIRLIKNPYFWTVMLVVIGGTFMLGQYFGSTKFDKEKLEFYEQTIQLNKDLRQAEKDNKTKDSVISGLTKRKKQLADSLKMLTNKKIER